MKIKDVIGIDVSKLTIDASVHQQQSSRQFINSNEGFKKLCKWSLKQSKQTKENLLFIFEHTGLYSQQLSVYLSKEEYHFVIVPGLAIKRSLGIARGKDDRVDAKRIALYGYRLREEIKLTKLPSEEINKIKSLLTQRDKMVRQRAGYKASFKEMKRVMKIKDNKVLFQTQKSIIKSFDKQIDAIEKEINQIITDNEDLERNYYLLKSITGIGDQIALYLIVLTENFTKFNNSRKFASYCGIAPFPNSSGTSIRGKTKVSSLANKKMKSLLDLGAKSSIQFNTEMMMYYQRRLEEGKNKMSTINIIRNKLLSRAFAVVKRQTPYVNTIKYAA